MILGGPGPTDQDEPQPREVRHEGLLQACRGWPDFLRECMGTNRLRWGARKGRGHPPVRLRDLDGCHDRTLARRSACDWRGDEAHQVQVQVQGQEGLTCRPYGSLTSASAEPGQRLRELDLERHAEVRGGAPRGDGVEALCPRRCGVDDALAREGSLRRRLGGADRDRRRVNPVPEVLTAVPPLEGPMATDSPVSLSAGT